MSNPAPIPPKPDQTSISTPSQPESLATGNSGSNPFQIRSSGIRTRTTGIRSPKPKSAQLILSLERDAIGEVMWILCPPDFGTVLLFSKIDLIFITFMCNIDFKIGLVNVKYEKYCKIETQYFVPKKYVPKIFELLRNLNDYIYFLRIVNPIQSYKRLKIRNPPIP